MNAGQLETEIDCRGGMWSMFSSFGFGLLFAFKFAFISFCLGAEFPYRMLHRVGEVRNKTYL